MFLLEKSKLKCAQPDVIRSIDPKTLRGADKEDYDALTGLIYNRINSIILDSLRMRSHHGEAVRFGDGVTRIGFPGILIESMDLQEMAAWLAVRHASANHPCPKCLVPHDSLCRLTRKFPTRTPSTMRAALEKARNAPNKTKAEDILRANGLHNFDVSISSHKCAKSYAVCSKFYGIFGTPIRTQLPHTTCFILATAENGDGIYLSL